MANVQGLAPPGVDTESRGSSLIE